STSEPMARSRRAGRRSTRGILLLHETRVERRPARRERAIGSDVEGEIGDHAEPLLGGSKVRLDLDEEVVGRGERRTRGEKTDRQESPRARPHSQNLGE